MQVIDLAQDLNVGTDGLILLLRELGIPVAGAKAVITEADVSRVLARIERERRAGHKEVSEALAAAIEDAQSAHRPRRRRRRAKREEAPPVEEDSVTAEDSESGGDGGAVAEAAGEPTPEGVSEGEGVVEDSGTFAEVGLEEAGAAEGGAQGIKAPAEDEELGTDEGEEDLRATEAVEEIESAEADVESEPGEVPDLVEEAELEPAEPAPKPEPVRRSGPEGPARVIRKPVSSPAASAAPGGHVRIQAEGYTQDGRRWLADAGPHLERAGLDPRELVRQR